MDLVKQRLHAMLSTDAPVSDLSEKLDPLNTPALRQSLNVRYSGRISNNK